MGSVSEKTEKRFRCSSCQRTFTRNDHLKRHQLRHTGMKPYNCQFCSTTFSRSDGLRDHYADCLMRGNRDIPATGSGGRRRHACSVCISMKLKCDGESPCGSCQRRKSECSNHPTVSPPTIMAQAGTSEPSLDRGSIRFLLNGGSEGWLSNFDFPPTEERPRDALKDPQVQSQYENVAHSAYNAFPNYADVSFDDVFRWGGPFMFAGGADSTATALTPRSFPEYMLIDEAAVLEPEQPWAIRLIEELSQHIPFNSPRRLDLLSNLQFLFTTTRIRKFIRLYFDKWHYNARVIYANSIDPISTNPPLLATVALMGALYSSEALETFAAKALLDYAELYCFATKTFAPEAEISNDSADGPGQQIVDDHDSAIQDLKACFLIFVMQHWTGTKMARHRAMEHRYTEIIKVARRLKLPKSRQLPEDRISETLWLRKESQIRLMAYLVLIDCALSFFQNFPCRLIPSELESELPCDESFFDSPHPYSEPGFTFSRQVTIKAAFEQFFTYQGGPGPLLAIKPTVLDMFTLIHRKPIHHVNQTESRDIVDRKSVLYVHVSNQIALLMPLLRIRNSREVLDQDASVKATKSALTTWRAVWAEMRSKIDEQQWASMGFWKNGLNYWCIAQFLIDKGATVDPAMRLNLEDDKLDRLKLILQDDSD